MSVAFPLVVGKLARWREQKTFARVNQTDDAVSTAPRRFCAIYAILSNRESDRILMWFDWLAVKRSWDHDIRIKTGCFQLFDIILIWNHQPWRLSSLSSLTWLLPTPLPFLKLSLKLDSLKLLRRLNLNGLKFKKIARPVTSQVTSFHTRTAPSTNSAWVATTSTGTATLALTTTAPSEAATCQNTSRSAGSSKAARITVIILTSASFASVTNCSPCRATAPGTSSASTASSKPGTVLTEHFSAPPRRSASSTTPSTDRIVSGFNFIGFS